MTTKSLSTSSAVQTTEQVACSECDLLINLTPPKSGFKACCPRCAHVITQTIDDNQDKIFAFAITSFIFLLFSLPFDFLIFESKGNERIITLLDSVESMVQFNFDSIALLLFFTTLLIPLLFLLGIIYVMIAVKVNQMLFGTKFVLKAIFNLLDWNMAEIFLIGVLVSLVKIASMAKVAFGLSFFAYTFFILFLAATAGQLDRFQTWRWVKKLDKENRNVTATSQKKINCEVCLTLNLITARHCITCESKLHKKAKSSIQYSVALLITGCLLYIPANIFPIMYTNLLGKVSGNTILGGVISLWHQGSYPIALIIFIASVVIPIAKIIALGWLCYGVATNRFQSHRKQHQLYRVTEFVGRWSMVDVFVVVILVALIQMGNIMSVYPGIAAIAFAGTVILTMLSAMLFDPKLIWQSMNKNQTV